VVELKLSYDAFGWSICGILVALKVFSLGKDLSFCLFT